MKERKIRYIAKGILMFTILTASVVLYTGSTSFAEEADDGQPGIAVVDKQGVGQTGREIEKGMNDDVIYDPETKTLTWKIGNDYELMEDYTYYITFKIKEGEVKRAEVRR